MSAKLQAWRRVGPEQPRCSGTWQAVINTRPIMRTLMPSSEKTLRPTRAVRPEVGSRVVLQTIRARLQSRITRVRRWLAKRIDPGPAIPPEGEFFISQALRGATVLRERLGITEELYLTVAGQALADARAYVL